MDITQEILVTAAALHHLLSNELSIAGTLL